jgi:hypothetical protein
MLVEILSEQMVRLPVRFEDVEVPLWAESADEFKSSVVQFRSQVRCLHFCCLFCFQVSMAAVLRRDPTSVRNLFMHALIHVIAGNLCLPWDPPHTHKHPHVKLVMHAAAKLGPQEVLSSQTPKPLPPLPTGQPLIWWMAVG